MDTGVKLDFAYQAALEACVESRDLCEEMLQELPRKEFKRVRELSGQLKKALKGVHNDFVIPEEYATAWTACESLWQEFATQYILGEKTDADWQTFVDTWNSYGGADVAVGAAPAY